MQTSLFYRLFYAKGNLSYLEAPLEEISDMMSCIEGLEYSEWTESSFEERIEDLQRVEFNVAEISHHPLARVF